MRILVTGATGFTGKQLCRRLVQDGYAVRVLVRDPGQCAEFLRYGMEVVKGDLRDPHSLKEATREIDTVYHLAAIYRIQSASPQEFRVVNAEGTERLLQASCQNGVRRFVHCSTVGVHGHIAHPPGNEETPYGPGDLYQRTKLEGELVAQRYMKEEKLAVTIFRPVGIYGPGDLRFLKLFRAIHKRRFVMLGSGEVTYHLTYIDDLIDGILLCGKKDEAVGKIYILGGNGYVKLNELVEIIADELKVARPSWHFPLWPVYAAGFVCELACKPFKIEPPLYRRRIDFFKKSRAFDISKAGRELGFQPKVDLKEGIHRTASWYFENRYLRH